MQQVLERSALRIGELEVVNQENKKEFQLLEQQHEQALHRKNNELEKKEMKIQLQFWVIEQIVS